jgi:hypothetical protein
LYRIKVPTIDIDAVQHVCQRWGPSCQHSPMKHPPLGTDGAWRNTSFMLWSRQNADITEPRIVPKRSQPAPKTGTTRVNVILYASEQEIVQYWPCHTCSAAVVPENAYTGCVAVAYFCRSPSRRTCETLILSARHAVQRWNAQSVMTVVRCGGSVLMLCAACRPAPPVAGSIRIAEQVLTLHIQVN